MFLPFELQLLVELAELVSKLQLYFKIKWCMLHKCKWKWLIHDNCNQVIWMGLQQREKWRILWKF